MGKKTRSLGLRPPRRYPSGQSVSLPFTSVDEPQVDLRLAKSRLRRPTAPSRAKLKVTPSRPNEVCHVATDERSGTHAQVALGAFEAAEDLQGRRRRNLRRHRRHADRPPLRHAQVEAPGPV